MGGALRYQRLHFFYDQLCPECAVLNWRKRNQSADLTGRVILLTGSRVKIGYGSRARVHSFSFCKTGGREKNGDFSESLRHLKLGLRICSVKRAFE